MVLHGWHLQTLPVTCFKLVLLLLLLPILDLLKQFEGYVKGIACEKGKKKRKKRKEVSLKICTKPGVNLIVKYMNNMAGVL